MIHATQDLVGIQNDLMAPLTLDVRDEAHAATIPFLIRAVKTMGSRLLFSAWSSHVTPVVKW